MIVLTS